jgi:hypothetical protein
MSIAETMLIYVGIPLGASLLLALAVYGKVTLRRDRYRPGRPWTYPAVWFVPHPAALAKPSGPSAPALSAGVTPPALTGGTASADAVLGGASGEW